MLLIESKLNLVHTIQATFHDPFLKKKYSFEDKTIKRNVSKYISVDCHLSIIHAIIKFSLLKYIAFILLTERKHWDFWRKTFATKESSAFWINLILLVIFVADRCYFEQLLFTIFHGAKTFMFLHNQKRSTVNFVAKTWASLECWYKGDVEILSAGGKQF